MHVSPILAILPFSVAIFLIVQEILLRRAGIRHPVCGPARLVALLREQRRTPDPPESVAPAEARPPLPAEDEWPQPPEPADVADEVPWDLLERGAGRASLPSPAGSEPPEPPESAGW
jgi:hypothetical protein